MPGTQRTLDEYRQLIFRHAWSETGLGSLTSWPPLLRRSLDLILDTMQPSFIVWGGEHAIVFNEAFARGVDAGECLGRSVPTLWGEAWPNVAPFYRDALNGRGVLAEDVPLRGLSGDPDDTRYFTLSLSPLREIDGQVMGVLGICSDSTEKIRAKTRLEKEHERLVRLLEDAPVFVGKLSVPDFRFLAANSASRTLVGDREVIGRTVAEALPELAEQGLCRVLDEVCRTGEPFIGRGQELVLRNPGGDETRIVDVVCAPFKAPDGSVEAILVAGNDVTDHVRANRDVEELRHELIHLSRVSAMGTMASTLGHELNQPLTAIVNYATVARRTLPDGASALLETALDAISENALRAGQLIRSLRAMSRKGRTVQRKFRISDAVEEAVKLTRFSYRCQILVRCEADLESVGDRLQIEQVLINLVRNACEAVAGVAEPRVDVTACRDGEKASIVVRDNGSGIALDPVDKVFAPFMSTKPDGIGIGLPISRTIAEAHDGRLWAENNPEGGASFRLEIPCEPPAADAEPAAAPEALRGRRVDADAGQSLEP
jgi:signal transduction histidine kinase